MSRPRMTLPPPRGQAATEAAIGRDRRAAGTLTSVSRTSIDLPTVRVVVVGPRGAAIEAPLEMTPLVVGSDPACDLVIDDARVSRRHCEVRLGEAGAIVRDLGSKNGTMLHGVALFEALVPPGVELRVGSSRLSLRVGEGKRKVALSTAPRFGDALGASVVMRALFAQLEVAALTDETILLLGESGTGKELLARAIASHSGRKGGPFVVVDCAAIAPQLVEAELFGFVKGAFTDASAPRPGLLEQAHGGTLFIDEIGELPLDLQPKLLRALESRTVRRVGSNDYRAIDVRVVAATHRDLRARVAAGDFRQDLYYRLAVVEATVPPLRERRDDIPLLVEQLLASQNPPRSWSDLPPNCLELLTAHAWPGNVRELRNVVSRLLMFPSAIGAFKPDAASAPTPAPIAQVARLPLREARDAIVESFERTYISIRLAEANGNVSRAAEAMEVSRQFLHRLIERYGLRDAEGGNEG